MPQIIRKENIPKILISLLFPILIILIKPIGLSLNQSIVLGSLFLTVIWWASGIVYKDAASIFLIFMFVLFGGTPIEKVFFFPLSDNFILVIASYLLSQGIVNSKVADKFSSFILEKYCYNSIRLVIMSFLLGIGLIFVIPQPFPRVILLASIYINFLKNSKVDKEEKSVLIFSVFVASTITSLMFLNGDVIINYSALKFGGISMTYIEWAKNMLLPTLITTIIIAAAFILVFKKNLKGSFERKNTEEKISFENSEKKALFITFVVVLLWLTESIHGISSANVALIGVIAMFIAKIIGIKDFKVINISLLIFLTAEFSIGKVLTGSGIADNLRDFLTGFFPSPESIMYIPFIIILIMFLHMIMGSLVTAASVLIPTLITLTAGNLSPQFIVMLSVVSICFHYIMPFHHVTIMIGYGNEYYENRHVMKIGIILTFITIFTVLFVYIPWWKLVGVI
ncbi:SLC13 family permease [Maledivibacter halophilus]|uniref:Sodium-dependent dicarboxylate transporter SdcS n=1 Tax=Maledivibacter halophilus TaxID=36842 RepID=A0A1T5LZQ2_9FIRM|nr:anion permease [Maledivibacter halophilus]SKC81018.1 Di-and tricarboxylate transporter [Maledivibacter halophilus]